MYMIILEATKYVNVTYNLGDLAEWFSVIATLAAVAVSLYLANRKDRPRINFDIHTENGQLMLTVINISFRPVFLEVKYGKINDNRKSRGRAALNPLKNKADIKDLVETNPYAGSEYIYGLGSDKNQTARLFFAKDIISGANYKIMIIPKNGQWKLVQYRFAIGKFILLKRRGD